MKIVLIAVIALFFLGCADQVEKSEMVPSDGRFTLEKVQSFESYNGNRSIFILTDKKTGIEYVGVSGIGISETGSHSIGKTTTSDER